MPAAPVDPRAAVFCSPVVPELFHAVAHHQEIWRRDPYDVETIHAEARADFDRLLNRATTAPPPPAGRILLLLGESGSGKTHLLRAFRSLVHGSRAGYCGYLQMTTAASSFDRYVLSKLLESLDQPYLELEGDTSGLMRLANSVAETPHSITLRELERLREGTFTPEALEEFVQYLAENMLQEAPYARLDGDLIRALLLMQQPDPNLRGRLVEYFRCEDLSPRDRQRLGGLVPRPRDEDPQRVLAGLGRIMAAMQSAALVVCFDQFDDLNSLDNAERQFRRAVATICALAEQVPSSLFVIACLEDFYEQWKRYLNPPQLDRLERDPEPVRITSPRSAEEITQLVGRRLQYLYDGCDVPFDENEPTYPFPPAELAKLTHLRTRDVLDWCRAFRERCVAAGRIVHEEVAVAPALPAPPLAIDLTPAWNDVLAAAPAPPEDEAALAALLASGVQGCSEEVTTGHRFTATTNGRFLRIEVQSANGGSQRLLAGICDKRPQGGALSKQIQEVEERAGADLPIVVRSNGFPPTPRTKIADQIGKLVARGGRRVAVADSDWRAVQAFQEFRRQHNSEPAFRDWLREERPLSRLKALRDLLDLDHLQEAPAPPPAVPAPPLVGRDEPLLLGTSHGLQPVPVTLLPQELTRHAAFLGGSGSGKTTLALNVIEQLLLRGIPVLMLDRKGDLCGYARSEVWTLPLDADRAARREQLRQRLDIALYTPGNPDGRPLSIPLAPAELDQLPSAEREHLTHCSAAALGGMMGYKEQKPSDASRLAVLSRAIEIVSGVVPSAELTLDHLVQVLDGPDPSLLAVIGRLDPRLCRPLVQDLETLRLNKKQLLSANGERLQVEALLGLGEHAVPGKTRLCIISTKFLGDNASIEFWVAQLLLEIGRYANRHPQNELQAVLLFDEADLYLPAMRKPATKEPMENLLKRARSAGIGMLLASQSPGDFEYRCRDNVRTWLLGRITQQTSIGKMKPILTDCRVDVAAKLPGQQPGQFFLVREGEAVGFQAQRSFLATEQAADDVILRLAASVGKSVAASK